MPSLSRITSVQSTAVLSFQLVSNCVPLQPSTVCELRDGMNYASKYGTSKILTKIILGRIEKKIDENIAEDHFVFQKNRGTREAILCLQTF